MTIQFTTRLTSRSAKVGSLPTPYTQPPQIKSRVVDLLAPLQLLDQRLRQMLEVRRIFSGTAFEQFSLGGVVPVRAPVKAIALGSSLANLRQTFELSEFEIEVVLIAIAPELDRRYERLYAQLQPSACRKPTQRLSLDVLCHTLLEKENACNAFSATAPLIRFDLIHLKPNGSFSLNPTVSRYLLGQPMKPQVSAYCQLSRPTGSGYITHSPRLSNLLNRIHEGTLPTSLAINFVGQGAKSAGASAIAIARNQPLLTVHLAEFLADQTLSDTEIIYKVQQVVLQARLWNAVLYMSDSEDPVSFHRQWFSSALNRSTPSFSVQRQNAVSQVFLDPILAYSGTVIFSGRALCMLAANHCKGLITIPFAAPSTALSETDFSFNYCWPYPQKAVPKPLSETEWFRQKVIGTALKIN